MNKIEIMTKKLNIKKMYFKRELYKKNNNINDLRLEVAFCTAILSMLNDPVYECKDNKLGEMQKELYLKLQSSKYSEYMNIKSKN